MTETRDLRSFLLVREGSDKPWVRALQQVVSPLGDLQMISEREAVEMVAKNRYDAVLVDAGAIGDTNRLVSRLHVIRTDLPIVVFTSSPTWQRAREAFRAGAVDYVRKSLDETEIRSQIDPLLQSPPPKTTQQPRRSIHAQGNYSLC